MSPELKLKVKYYGRQFLVATGAIILIFMVTYSIFLVLFTIFGW